jgi:hypothetical protein
LTIRRTVLALGAAGTLFLAACGSDDDSSTPTFSSATPSTTTSSSTTSSSSATPSPTTAPEPALAPAPAPDSVEPASPVEVAPPVDTAPDPATIPFADGGTCPAYRCGYGDDANGNPNPSSGEIQTYNGCEDGYITDPSLCGAVNQKYPNGIPGVPTR